MYTPLLALTSLLAGRIALADQAITSPINGTTVQPGAQIDFRWYSDDDDDDNAVQFDVALISFVPVHEYTRYCCMTLMASLGATLLRIE